MLLAIAPPPKNVDDSSTSMYVGKHSHHDRHPASLHSHLHRGIHPLRSCNGRRRLRRFSRDRIPPPVGLQGRGVRQFQYRNHGARREGGDRARASSRRPRTRASRRIVGRRQGRHTRQGPHHEDHRPLLHSVVRAPRRDGGRPPIRFPPRRVHRRQHTWHGDAARRPWSERRKDGGTGVDEERFRSEGA